MLKIMTATVNSPTPSAPLPSAPTQANTDANTNVLPHMPLYPLRFAPVYKSALWGGGRFRSLLNRVLPAELCTVAESWEVCDRDQSQSIIQNGPFRGYALNDVVRQRPLELFGESCLCRSPKRPSRFPLMLKFLDAAQSLSIQVHPDDHLAEEMNLLDGGKSEAWVVMDARPGSSLLLGTAQTCSRRELAEAIQQGVPLESLLNRVAVQPGDCFYLSPGTIHALGEGVMVAEVQTNSDVSFRLYDWDRLDPDGRPRKLMLEEALRAAADPCEPVTALVPRTAEASRRFCEQLVCEKNFTLNRWTIFDPISWVADSRCHLWTVLEGSVDALFTAGRRTTKTYRSGRECDPDAIETLQQGDTLLVPASCRSITWIPEGHTQTVLLDVIVENATLRQPLDA